MPRMRLSHYPINTLKETPAEAEIVSHQLMLRAGLIRRLAAGLYTWLPLGLRTLQQGRDDRARGDEPRRRARVLMPAMQPAELWQESGRWEEYRPGAAAHEGPARARLCVGPTHEEVITDIARREIKSYRQLPVNFYQIQTKFRDEIRPRFGVMRAREFIMKDAYSFHVDEASLARRLPRDVRCLQAHLHAHGTAVSLRAGRHRRHRRQTSRRNSRCSPIRARTRSPSPTAMIMPPISRLAAALPPAAAAAGASRSPCAVSRRPGAHTIAELCALSESRAARCLKTLLVEGDEDDAGRARRCAAITSSMRSRRRSCPGVASPAAHGKRRAHRAVDGREPGYIGPVGLNGARSTPITARSPLADFVCGANEKDMHYTGVNWDRDLPGPVAADLRNVVAGDPSPTGRGTLKIVRGIEVGHIFQLGRKYSAADERHGAR